ncbi:MAG: adenosylcobalamin-dependent ribonucleoside-diphosphate reductase [Candidatus Aminicenantia bacterium]
MVKSHGFSENALRILRARYFMRNEKGELLEKTPEELFKRVADFVASAEKNERERKFWAKKFYDMIMRRDFMPNSPTLTGAGRDMCLSACFVLPIEDSLASIFETVKNAALVHKEGGGTGFDFSRLRSRGSFVRKTQGIASGPISFLKVIDAATEAVKQGGTRRGANMGILRVDHPDIEEFILLKRDGKTLTNFNISVAITEKFMNALKKNEDYEIFDPHTQSIVGMKSASQIMDMIVESAWVVGDPGIVFIDRINELNSTRELGEIRATNPCGEQPLHDYESCNLGSINLSNFWNDEKNEFEWERFEETIKLGVRFLDNVIEVNKFPLPQIKELTFANRRIGLGVMGFADLLIKMKIKYDSEEAVEWAEKIAKFLREKAEQASRELAEERGNFPNIDKSIYKGGKMRNATLITIAPTGTISRIAGCSSSIEPIFAFEMVSKIIDSEIKDVHPLYKKWKEENPDSSLPTYFVTAHEIEPEWHIRMQAAFQKYTDNAVSKTINFPNSASKEDIKRAYLLAYDLGVKGVTVYRDGCRAEQVLYKAEEKERPAPMDRPDSLSSVTDKIRTGFGNLYITITFYNDKPFEVFASIGKSGYSTMADAEAIGRLISLCLRSGIDTKEVINQLKGIGGSEPIFHHGHLVQSIPDAIAQVLERHVGHVNVNQKDLSPFKCPSCGTPLPDEKCPVCPNCGWTKCV